MKKINLRTVSNITEETADKLQTALGDEYTVTYQSYTGGIAWDIIHVETQIGFRLASLNPTNYPYASYVYPIQTGEVQTSKRTMMVYSDSSNSSMLFIKTTNGLLVTILNGGSYLSEIALNTSTVSCVVKPYASTVNSSKYSLTCVKFTNDRYELDVQYSTASALLGITSENTFATQFVIGDKKTGIYFINSGFNMIGTISNSSTSIFVGQCLGILESGSTESDSTDSSELDLPNSILYYNDFNGTRVIDDSVTVLIEDISTSQSWGDLYVMTVDSEIAETNIINLQCDTFKAGESLTIGGWFNFNDTSTTWHRLLCVALNNEDNSESEYIRIYVQPSTGYLCLDGFIADVMKVDINTWYHVCLVMTHGSDIISGKLYVNGNLVYTGSYSSSMYHATKLMTSGKDYKLNGMQKNIFFSNTEYSLSDILKLM